MSQFATKTCQNKWHYPTFMPVFLAQSYMDPNRSRRGRELSDNEHVLCGSDPEVGEIPAGALALRGLLATDALATRCPGRRDPGQRVS